ncbi:MAG: YrdB family protein [Candidatus Marinimicrobia bacterium]|nr:YrdB family protein [Candidatus Neomarinimicrobiota bacterium]
MGSHPLNLAIRFLLELSGLLALGLWGWKQSDGWTRYILAIGIPLLLAAMWGSFAVPDDPSRSGSAPIVVSGLIRLGMELSFFTLATWALHDLGYPNWWWIMGATVIFHYLASYDRIQWLLTR